MKTFATLFFASLLFAAVCKERRCMEGTINPLIGDISFEAKYGMAPDEYTDGNLRIATHLEYVEKQLRMRDVSMLPADLRNKRAQSLDLLHAYWSAGVFPKNPDARGRKACLIDRSGTMCAVGYLIEQTAGRALAEELNDRHQTATIFEINDKKFNAWINRSGLSKEECTMIQPVIFPSKL